MRAGYCSNVRTAQGVGVFEAMHLSRILFAEEQSSNPDPREDPKSRSLKGVLIKYPLVARVPN